LHYWRARKILTFSGSEKQGYLDALRKNNIPVVNEIILANAWTKELGADASKTLVKPA
jgi:LacI family repressor for deo operon, udp, cdd, tsx, nupC, and nupG